jgi:hypothetical protein
VLAWIMGVHQAIPVERVSALSREAFRERFFTAERPVVLVGAVLRWKACSSWTEEYLRSTIGDVVVSVSVSTDGIFGGDPKKGMTARREVMKVSDFLDLMYGRKQSAKRYYLQQQLLHDAFPALAFDIEAPIYGRHKQLGKPALWLGPAGSISPAHYDISHNFLAQVSGRKRVVLYPRRDLDKLYPFSMMSSIPHLSRVDIEKPDLTRFPRFIEATAFEATLEPGDMLFIPFAWWHQVYSIEAGASVNFFWSDGERRCYVTPSALRMILFLARGNMKYLVKVLAARISGRRPPAQDNTTDSPDR